MVEPVSYRWLKTWKSGSVAEFAGKKTEDHGTFTAERCELGLESHRSAAFNSGARAMGLPTRSKAGASGRKRTSG